MIAYMFEIEQRLAEIKELVNDPERARVAEDNLYVGVLQGIAAGAWSDAEPFALARLALKARDIDFPRWSA